MNLDKVMKQHTFNFNGTGAEFFGIWIVNILLTILTLGIYSAWATVRTKKYFYGNTEVNGQTFDYHATPIQILIGRIIALVLLGVFFIIQTIFPISLNTLLPLLALGAIFMIMRSIAFNVNMSSYSNVRFRFTSTNRDIWNAFANVLWLLVVASIIGFIAILVGENAKFLNFMLTPLLVIMYLFIPFIQAKIANYQLNNMQYGQFHFSGKITSGDYYLAYIAVGIIIAMLFISYFLFIVGFAGVNSILFESGYSFILGLFFAITYIVALAFMGAVMKTLIRNYTFNQVAIPNELQLKSTITIKKLFFLYLKNSMLIMLTLGLAIPWIKVMNARFSAEHTFVEISDTLLDATADVKNASAIGDEIASNFDVDISPGIGV